RGIPCDLRAPSITTEDIARVTHVLHCAAAVSFDQTYSEARATNVDGTLSVLEMAERMPRLERLVHVSTAYVAGKATGTFGEDDLQLGQGFRNSYELSKHTAEILVSRHG